MAATEPFARRLVNSGRLSEPCRLDGLSLQSRDDPQFAAGLPPGSPCLDAPVRDARGNPSWLLDHLGGDFVLVSFGDRATIPAGVRGLTVLPAGVDPRDDGSIEDSQGLAASRYDAKPGTAYLIRPDQHVAARFREPTCEAVAAALARASGKAA